MHWFHLRESQCIAGIFKTLDFMADAWFINPFQLELFKQTTHWVKNKFCSKNWLTSQNGWKSRNGLKARKSRNMEENPVFDNYIEWNWFWTNEYFLSQCVGEAFAKSSSRRQETFTFIASCLNLNFMTSLLSSFMKKQRSLKSVELFIGLLSLTVSSLFSGLRNS